VHPDEDPSQLDLLNAELRWSYTVAFQALAKFVLVVGESDPATTSYSRACLLRYGRWMLENERLYLDNPGDLEFPTETWPAQDLRKANCLLMAAMLTSGPEADNFIRRGRELFRNAWGQLATFETRVCTRPAALVLQQLPIYYWLMEYYSRELASSPRTEESACEWPKRERFHPQKQQIKSDLKSPKKLLNIVYLLTRPLPWRHLLPHTKLGSVVRAVRRQLFK
jgi:hypothetical protein